MVRSERSLTPEPLVWGRGVQETLESLAWTVRPPRYDLVMARITTFRFALDLTSTQERTCYRYAGAARKAFNWGVAQVNATMQLRNEQLRDSGKSEIVVPFTRNALIPAFNAFKHSEQGYEDGIAHWFHEVSKFCFEEALVDLSRGLTAWKRGRAGFPRFKKKGRSKDSFRLRQSNPGDIRVGSASCSRSIRLPRLGWLKVHEDTRRLRRLLRGDRNGSPNAKILQATISRGVHRWFLSLTVEAPDLHIAKTIQPGDTTFVGVDLGITSFAVVAREEGRLVEVVVAPRPLKSNLKKLKRLSRSLSNTQSSSKGRIKARRRLAAHHERVANIRRDFTNQLSSRLTNTHGRLAVETLKVAAMVRNGHLSRSISDAGWSQFLTRLSYKANWKGAYLAFAPTFLPSSKTCSGCGIVKVELPLSERAFSCDDCGMKIDRDLNAAINLARYGRAEFELQKVAAGRAETLNAGGEESSGRAGIGAVKLSSLKSEPASAGQPRRLPSRMSLSG